MKCEIDWYDNDQFIFSVDDLINSYCSELYVSMVVAFGEDKVNEKDFFEKFTLENRFSELFRLVIVEKEELEEKIS